MQRGQEPYYTWPPPDGFRSAPHGHTFDLAEHPDDAQSREDLITAITHHVGPIEASGGARTGLVGYRPFRGDPELGAVPARAQDALAEHPRRDARPHRLAELGQALDARLTGALPRPLSFDASGKTGDKSSTWVRLVQPYAGAGYGSHHPLHLGTELENVAAAILRGPVGPPTFSRDEIRKQLEDAVDRARPDGADVSELQAMLRDAGQATSARSYGTRPVSWR